MALADNILAYWTLDEASGSRADSVGSETLAQTGTVGSTTGALNSAASFSGSNGNYLSHADDATLSVGDTDFSISLWVYLANTSSVGVIFQKGSGSSLEYSFLQANSEVRCSFFDASISEVRMTQTGLSAGQWYHFVLTHDSVNNVVKLYVNAGTPQSTSWTTGVHDSNGVLVVGNRMDNDIPFAGRVDEIGLWRRVLSSTDVTTLYGSGTPPAYPFSSGPTYTLTTAAGTFTLTGEPTGLTAGRKLTAAQASYTLTGEAAGLKAGRLLAAAQASFTLTGEAAGLLAGRLLTATSATYTLTGEAVTLTYTPLGGPTYTLTAAQAAYTLTGEAAGLIASRKLAAAQASFTLTGTATGLLAGRHLAAATGTLTLTGEAAGLVVSRDLVTAAGTYVLTGRAAGLTYSAAVTVTPGRPVSLPGTDRSALVIPGADRSQITLTSDLTR